MELAENQSMRLSLRVAFEARLSGIGNGILRLVVAHEALESPSARTLIELGIFDHYVDSPALAFRNDSVILRGFPQFVHNHRSIGEVTRRVAFDRLLIREDVVHSLFALRELTAGQDHSRPHMHPASKVVGILHRFSPAQDAQ